jgi:hypothetical protein
MPANLQALSIEDKLALSVQWAQRQKTPAVELERVLISGDLAGLNANERVDYYRHVCESLNLNPLTKPFEYISLNNKLVLYAKRDCTDQLRARDRISIQIVSREVIEEVYMVTARATKPDGREDESTGAVPVANLKGEARANAYMKAETKAKRRVTLSICGLGILDESEINSALNWTPTVEPAVVETPVVEVQASPAPLPPAPEKPAGRKALEESYANMREAIGEVAFYRILMEAGFNNAGQIKTRSQHNKVWPLLDAEYDRQYIENAQKGGLPQ